LISKDREGFEDKRGEDLPWRRDLVNDKCPGFPGEAHDATSALRIECEIVDIT
jgi:hypothetical protein